MKTNFTKSLPWQLLTAGSFIALTACGAATPPPELVDARAAYVQAEQGAAGQYAPAKLDSARKALDSAEQAFEGDSESEETRALAYVAERKARVAASAGELEKLQKKRAELDSEYLELERKAATMTKEELEATRKRLDIAKDQNAQNQAELARKQAELEKEKAAREAAEGRLTAAIESLKEMGSIKAEARGMVITLNGSVLFATGKSELLPIAQTKLDEVAAALKDQGFKKIVIEGHTDSRGSAKDNEKLSLARATSVKNQLVSRGLDTAKIEAVGLASTRPVATNDTPEGRANNRRVELIVTEDK